MELDKKNMSDIDKKIREIADNFNVEYVKWWSGEGSESSSKRGNRIPSALRDSSRSSSISKPGRPKANCVETSSELPGHEIRGFENEILFLESFLLNNKESKEFKALAIVGKFGVGKTTLCQVLFNKEAVKQAYLPRIWVSMYSKETKEDDDPKIAVVKRILLSLGVEDETLKDIETKAVEEKKAKEEAGEKDEETDKEKELSLLLHALNLKLTEKKYLIILDDVWEDNKWDQRLDVDEKKNQQERCHLSCGFPKGFGGRVIVTSRDEKLAKKIVGEEENLQRLFPRSDADSVWEIYNDATEKKVKPRYPGRFRTELMDKSCGVPWAVRMLATIEPMPMDETGGDVEWKKSTPSSKETNI